MDWLIAHDEWTCKATMRPFFFTKAGHLDGRHIQVCCMVCGGYQAVVLELQKKKTFGFSDRARNSINKACKAHLDGEEHRQNDLMRRLANDE